MSGLELIEPTALYNLLNQSTVYSCLSDPNYLLLLDARKKHEYNESHIVTAKKAPKNENDEFMVPYEAELECKTHVIIYDGNTSNLKDQGAAFNCAKFMWDMGSRNTVKVLKGGYEDFSALYPFLRTQKILYMPQEYDDLQPYPTEIIPGLLYLGNWRQGNAAYVQKDLKVKGHVVCCEEKEEFFSEGSNCVLHLPVTDTEDADLYSHFMDACLFINEHQEANSVVLVFSKLGISRSVAVVIAYLMHHYSWTLKEAYQHAAKCSQTVRPNRGFVEQLSRWEEELKGEKITEITDPEF